MTRYGLVALASLGFTQSALSNFPVTLNFSGVCLWEAGLTLDFHQLSSIPKDTPESPSTGCIAAHRVPGRRISGPSIMALLGLQPPDRAEFATPRVEVCCRRPSECVEK